ncbi:kefB [Symbiodinium natans]|uniref:KefB protein n=1 Tax=Symbiodinium natans TaxID=878477 RepID=A0A812II43_9DINO|nr:kefB [Symbiodinium natans]
MAMGSEDLESKAGNYGSVDETSAPQRDTAEKTPVSILLQAVVYALAILLLGLIFVIPSPLIDPKGEGHHAAYIKQGRQMVMRNIIYGTLSAGCLAYVMHLLRQPLILGYLLGGVLVGPVGLRLVIDEQEIATMSELGLIFLLFMIGLELNVKELARLGSKIFFSGLMQFPICVVLHLLAFSALAHLGFPISQSRLQMLYFAVCCGMSSTMIVVKKLQDANETKMEAGQISIGILIFQDMWAIVVLALQPNINQPRLMGIARTFAVMLALVCVTFLYAKYVLHPLMRGVAGSSEMNMILFVCWCFFVCAAAMLPFVNVSIELAALVAGASLATFPGTETINKRIRYIRDFFVTLYFVSLGMEIPYPTKHVFCCACAISLVVMSARWVGVFCTIYGCGGDPRSATRSTINLSQISEFALVITAIGCKQEHVPKETLTILSWTFVLLAVLSSPLMDHGSSMGELIYAKAFRLDQRLLSDQEGRKPEESI